MSDGPERRIVVGVEGSGYARAALIWALEEAHHRGAVIEVVTCYSPTYVPAAPDLGYVPLDSFDLAAEVEKMQGEVIESAVEASDFGDEVEVRRVLQKGRPADTLMTAAEGATMLVVGNRGRGGFAGLRLGSVSQAIAHHSPCPLVIVRTGLADH
ncbi:MAG: universal stress protein [Acidimicrobiales bacterium]|jgi:nucleotide-binding universal stress UspA family protein|nr:universal stress protein [Acidimicrobiales bacterium]